VSKARSVKQWTREALAFGDDTVVSVNEVACALPECPPKETIILVMGTERQTRQVSTHKPLIELDFIDCRNRMAAPYVIRGRGPDQRWRSNSIEVKAVASSRH
jgi:hypothetical protein